MPRIWIGEQKEHYFDTLLGTVAYRTRFQYAPKFTKDHFDGEFDGVRVNNWIDVHHFKQEYYTAICVELKRLAKLPSTCGWFTLLHHEGPFVEASADVWERIEFIVRQKEINEVLIRLKNIHRLDEVQTGVYNSVYQNYMNIATPLNCGVSMLNDMLYERLKTSLPFCSWNGRDIF